MSLDLENDYKKAKEKVKSIKNYKDLKTEYVKAKKKTAKDSFEKNKSEVTKKVSKVSKKTNDLKKDLKKFEKKVKTQFDHLLEVLTLTNENGGNTYNYLKRTFLKTLNNIEPKILDILYKEIFKTVGCDQQQAFKPNTIVYIKVKSIDLVDLLKIDPNDIEGRCLYETRSLAPNDRPNATNKELYNRIQFPNVSFNTQYGNYYLGKSNQPLFDITYVENDDLGRPGPWYKVEIVNRGNNFLIYEFLLDYYKTIKVVEFKNILASIMEQLTGMISINIGAGQFQIEDMGKFQLIIQRILGLCFDEDKEIDVSGIAKVSELDGIDNSFFEFTDNDLSTIEERLENIRKGVVKFIECDDVEIPVDADAIINSLNNLEYIQDVNLIDAADNLTNQVNNDPQFNGFDIQIALNVNFIKLISQGLVVSLLSPKVLLPIYIAFKGLGNNAVDLVDSYVQFTKQFYGLVISLVSKVAALFIEELFEIIKKDIKTLVQQVIADIIKESNNKRLKMIAKLAEILIIVASLIQDWRRCKSVIDEILALLKLIPNNFNGIPSPLLLLSDLLDGYSETRAFINMIEEFQSLGIPTGTLPDGSPNLDILSRFGQMTAMANEEAENGKVNVAIPPLIVTPAFTTALTQVSGKKF